MVNVRFGELSVGLGAEEIILALPRLDHERTLGHEWPLARDTALRNHRLSAPCLQIGRGADVHGAFPVRMRGVVEMPLFADSEHHRVARVRVESICAGKR